MELRITLTCVLALVLTVMGATSTIAQQIGAGPNVPPPRPEGPCDIYTAAGDPCAAAHSTTRALYASYTGPLYQVLRQSDGKTLDIGVVQPAMAPYSDAGGYADAAARDKFCVNNVLLDRHDLRPIGKAQQRDTGSARRIQRPGDGWL